MKKGKRRDDKRSEEKLSIWLILNDKIKRSSELKNRGAH